MGKKTIYGDPRKVDYGDNVDILDSNVMDKIHLERKKMQSIYDSMAIRVPKIGETYTVKYVGVNNDFFNFEGEFKDYLRIDNKPDESKYLKNINIGDSIDVLVTELDEERFIIKGSLSEIYETRARQILTDIKGDVVVTADVKELTPAGYSMDIHFEGVTLPGFMPNTLAGINKLSSPESIIGQNFEVMIESFAREEGTYIVSRRKYLQTLIPQAIKELEYGKVYDGIVTGTTQFGVFVEFNECLTGMIHKTNINPDWSERLHQISPGFEIQFYIKEVIKDKIILTQILRESLWDNIKIGQTINGKIKDIKPFGALVILDDETNGLIHTSELEKVSRKFVSGDDVRVKIIAIERSSRKIFLSVN